MKITTIETSKTIYKTKSIINNKCTYCKGDNVINNRCLDCMNNNPYIYFEERYQNKKDHTVEYMFDLSLKQTKASKFFLEHYKKRRDAFLFAVCGSGKTEIMYEVINYALNNQEKVLFAIPRKEIVKELYERLLSIFKNTQIKYLDGTHHDDNADLLISTVNQLIHYEDEFDLIILDEADAFPYSESDFLKRILKKSLKKNGVFFQMSATIKDKIKCDKFVMNRRYHQTDLSMPLFIRNRFDNILDNKEFVKIINNSNRKYIIYVPTIDKARELSDKLDCLYVSSKRKDSSEIINNFKINSNKILVSTTLLERGITIPYLDVIILDANDKVFNAETIIQISGRVGRSYKDNKGSIYIFYSFNEFKFLKVKNYIRRMNNDLQNM